MTIRLVCYVLAGAPFAAFLQILMLAYCVVFAAPLAAGVWIMKLDAKEAWHVWRLFAFGPASLFLRGFDHVRGAA